MATALAFSPAAGTLRKAHFVPLAAPADARVKARIRAELGGPELGEPHVDVLWRLTTKPWARARTGSTPPARRRVLAALETSMVVLCAAAMTFVVVACAVVGA